MKKKLLLLVFVLMYGTNSFSQCNIFADFHYYPEAGGFGWYTFYDVSYGVGLSNAQSYQWKVNGVNAGTNNILHYQFPSSGSYTVCEIISDPVTQCYYQPICKTVNITICPSVTVNYTASNNGNTYTFTNTSTGTVNPTTYKWTIDGTQASTASTFNYTFTTSGNHLVCLTVTSGGCTFEPKCYTVPITICPTISQSFQWNTTNGADYTFTDVSTGTMTNPTYNWKINGTTVATTKNMSHTFTNQGNYTICQTITANGCTYVPLCTDLYVCPPILMEVTHTHTNYSYIFTDNSRMLDNSALTGTLMRYWKIGTQDQSTHNQVMNYTFAGPGNYTVGLDLLHNSCMYSGYTGNLTITPSEIESAEAASLIKIFPNPFQDFLNMNFMESKIVSIEIIDASGKSVLRMRIEGESNISLDLSMLAEGLYTLRLNTQDGCIVKRIVKSKE